MHLTWAKLTSLPESKPRYLMEKSNRINERPGWVCLYRKSIDSTVFKDINFWHVWTWCLMKANFEDSESPFNGKDIVIKRGQFITGRNKALEEMPQMTAQKYRTAIEYLKSTNRITTNVTNKFTIITICKYDDYQNINKETNQQNINQTNQPLTNHQPTTNQPLTNEQPHLNKKNNYNKDNNPTKEGATEFLNKVIFEFKEAFEEVNKMPYVKTDEKKELSAASKITELYKGATNITDNQELLEQLKDYFKQVCSVKDTFLHKNLNLPYLSNNINAYNLAAKSSKNKESKQLTAEEIVFLETGVK
jgi:hypothetical protein